MKRKQKSSKDSMHALAPRVVAAMASGAAPDPRIGSLRRRRLTVPRRPSPLPARPRTSHRSARRRPLPGIPTSSRSIRCFNQYAQPPRRSPVCGPARSGRGPAMERQGLSPVERLPTTGSFRCARGQRPGQLVLARLPTQHGNSYRFPGTTASCEHLTRRCALRA